MKRQTATVDCPKSMVGRVIGKNGETIKALQTYTGALIQIDQTVEPTRVTISGTPHSLSLAVSMVTDIVKGTFKGFALLRQIANPATARPSGVPSPAAQPRPVYAPGYGLIPPSQLYGGDDRSASVVPVDMGARRPPGAMGWTGQLAPSQVLMGLQPLGMRPVSQQANAALLANSMGQLSLQGPGGHQMAYAYSPEYPGGVPGSEGIVYSDGSMMPPMMVPSPVDNMPVGGPPSANNLVPVPNDRQEDSSRSSPVAWPNHTSPPTEVSDLVTSSAVTDSIVTPGNWVQVMDPEGKLYYYSQSNG